MPTWLIIFLIIGVILIIAMSGVVYYCSTNEHPTHKLGGTITFFIPLFGQLISRFMYLSSSKRFDNIWLLFPLFWMPPFTIVPAYLIYNDMEYC